MRLHFSMRDDGAQPRSAKRKAPHCCEAFLLFIGGEDLCLRPQTVTSTRTRLRSCVLYQILVVVRAAILWLTANWIVYGAGCLAVAATGVKWT